MFVGYGVRMRGDNIKILQHAHDKIGANYNGIRAQRLFISSKKRNIVISQFRDNGKRGLKLHVIAVM